MLRWKAATQTSQITRYWEPPFGVSDWHVSAVQTVIASGAAVEAATARQLVSDVPRRFALERRTRQQPDHGDRGPRFSPIRPLPQLTRSASPAASNRLDQAHDDAPYARGLAAQLGFSFQEIEIAPHVASLLPTLIRHLDEPLADPAIISCFLSASLRARGALRCLLSGQGADELFGGYPRYAAFLRFAGRTVCRRRSDRAVADRASLLPGALGGPGGAAIAANRPRLRDVHRPPDERFLAYCMSTPPEAVNSVLNPDLETELGDRRPDDDCRLRMRARRPDGRRSIFRT